MTIIRAYRNIWAASAAVVALCAHAALGHAGDKVTHFGSGGLKTEATEHKQEISKVEVQDLLNALTDNDFSKRTDAQWKLRMLGDRSITPELTKLLNDKRPYVRQISCELLGEVGSKECIPAVTRVLLNDPDYHVREVAARILMTIGDRSAVAALVEAVNQPRPFPDTVGYWLLPNDIYDNYRYAAAETLNRLTHNNFYLRRNATNFDRIAAQKAINAWWRANKLYYTEGIDTVVGIAQEYMKAAKGLKESAAKLGSSPSAGADEFSHRVDTYADRAKDACALITALPAKKTRLFDVFRELKELTTSIDEIFVFSPELAELKADWEHLKGLNDKLAAALKDAGVRE